MNAPHVMFEGEGFRIVRTTVHASKREPTQPGQPDDDGIRDLIEVTDGTDLLGQQRWTRLEKKAEGVATYDRIVHALKRELLRLLPDAQEQE